MAQNINHSEKAVYWFRYIDCCMVINGWDTMPVALNGFDFDGDLVFSTNNQFLMKSQTNLPALNCTQRTAKKVIVTEDEIIQSNLNGFGSKIGQITNRITAITSLMANYELGSVEYETLKRRTQIGQALQQEEIDKAKGILPTPMPVEWYVYSENRIKLDDPEEEKEKKRLNQRICAHKKPYFFGYNYQSLKQEYDKCLAEIDLKLQNLFQKTLYELQNSENLTEQEQKALDSCLRQLPLDRSPSTMNRICWAIERHFDNFKLPEADSFDYSKYKSGCAYSEDDFFNVKQLCSDYQARLKAAQQESIYNQTFENIDKRQLLQDLKENCECVCPNREELCEILLDICYRDGSASTSIVWELCGDTIVENLLRHNNFKITYPERVKSDGFWCCGSQFRARTIVLDGEVCDDYGV